MMIGAQSACIRLIIAKAALYLAKSAFIHGVPANGTKFFLDMSRHDSAYHAGEFKKKVGKETAI